MQLINDFFTITNTTRPDEHSASFDLRLNASHFIYAAHFPGNPITPGVCQLIIVEELASQLLGRTMQLSYISNIKYSGIISPVDDPAITCELANIAATPDGCTLQATFLNARATFSKMTLTLRDKSAT